MLVAKLKCPACQFETDSFSETMDLYDGSYDLLLQNVETLGISIKRISEDVLSASGIKMDRSPVAIQKMQERFADASTRVIVFEIGTLSDVESSATCPSCKSRPLMKVNCGFS